MFFLKFPVFAALFVLFAAGCSSSGTGTGIVYAPPRADAATMEQRTAELAKTIAPCKIRGLELRPEELRERDLGAPEAFLDSVRAFGFNRLYLRLDTPGALQVEGLKELLERCYATGIPVEAVLPESAYVLGHRGNLFQRMFFSAGTPLDEMGRILRDFESKRFRFSGVTVLAEPHLFTRSAARRPKEQVYAWDEKTFGPGLDNDMLMGITIEKLEAFGRTLGGTPLTVAIPDFYEELVMEKKLSRGSAADFAKIAPKVMILDAGNKPSEVLEAVRNELADASPGSLLVALPLAEHISVTSGALRRRNWADYTRALGLAVAEWSKAPSFGGMILGPFSQIETLLQEK
jgi:hypothetical protein